MNTQAWLENILSLYRDHKEQCEKAAAQVNDEDLFKPPEGGGNSIAVLLKHVGENHRSRWRDFLTTDGEKRDRRREEEFVGDGETRASVEALWEAGWAVAFDTITQLKPDDISRTITIRGEPHSVMQAIQRNLAHVVYHTGQIAMLARHYAGDAWQSLSVPQGKTEEHNAAMRAKYGDWWEKEDGDR